MGNQIRSYSILASCVYWYLSTYLPIATVNRRHGCSCIK
jgi:hypothetical protein